MHKNMKTTSRKQTCDPPDLLGQRDRQREREGERGARGKEEEGCIIGHEQLGFSRDLHRDPVARHCPCITAAPRPSAGPRASQADGSGKNGPTKPTPLHTVAIERVEARQPRPAAYPPYIQIQIHRHTVTLLPLPRHFTTAPFTTVFHLTSSSSLSLSSILRALRVHPGLEIALFSCDVFSWPRNGCARGREGRKNRRGGGSRQGVYTHARGQGGRREEGWRAQGRVGKRRRGRRRNKWTKRRRAFRQRQTTRHDQAEVIHRRTSSYFVLHFYSVYTVYTEGEEARIWVSLRPRRRASSRTTWSQARKRIIPCKVMPVSFSTFCLFFSYLLPFLSLFNSRLSFSLPRYSW